MASGKQIKGMVSDDLNALGSDQFKVLTSSQVGALTSDQIKTLQTEDFAALFVEVARQEQAALVPFLLAGVADGPQPERLFQADRIHPAAEAQPAMLANVWPALAKLLK